MIGSTRIKKRRETGSSKGNLRETITITSLNREMQVIEGAEEDLATREKVIEEEVVSEVTPEEVSSEVAIEVEEVAEAEEVVIEVEEEGTMTDDFHFLPFFA